MRDGLGTPLSWELRVHVSHVSEQYVLPAGPVHTNPAAEHRRQAAAGAEMPLQARLPRVTLAATRADKDRLAGLVHRVVQQIAQVAA